MTPNQATAISAALSTAGIAVLAVADPSWLKGWAVAMLLAAGYVMDSVDGQLARLRGGGSVRGEWLDHTLDCAKTSSLPLAVAITWYLHPPIGDAWVLLVPLGFCVVQSTMYFGLILMPYLRTQRGAQTAPPQQEHAARAWLILPTDYGFLCWTFVLLGAPVLHLTVYTLLAGAAAAFLALALRKWWRDLA